MESDQRTWHAPPWTIVARTDQGLVRRRLEDAYCVRLSAPVGSSRAHLVGLFDGLGGVPNGLEAAQAAASGLPDVAHRAPDRASILPGLNRFVLRTGGATTAVIAILDVVDPNADLLAVGDSTIYGVGPEGWGPLLPRDADGPNVVGDYLGNPGLVGHRATHVVAPRGGIVLCTDGVDGVVEPDDLRPLVEVPPEDVPALVEHVFTEIRRRGAPDNATLAVVRKGPGPTSP